MITGKKRIKLGFVCFVWRIEICFYSIPKKDFILFSIDSLSEVVSSLCMLNSSFLDSLTCWRVAIIWLI